jgi:hypothetical protein
MKDISTIHKIRLGLNNKLFNPIFKEFFTSLDKQFKMELNKKIVRSLRNNLDTQFYWELNRQIKRKRYL